MIKWAKIVERNGIRREAQTMMLDGSAMQMIQRHVSRPFLSLPAFLRFLIDSSTPPPTQLTLFSFLCSLFFSFCGQLVSSGPREIKYFRPPVACRIMFLGCCHSVRGRVGESFFPFFDCRLVLSTFLICAHVDWLGWELN